MKTLRNQSSSMCLKPFVRKSKPVRRTGANAFERLRTVSNGYFLIKSSRGTESSLCVPVRDSLVAAAREGYDQRSIRKASL